MLSSVVKPGLINTCELEVKGAHTTHMHVEVLRADNSRGANLRRDALGRSGRTQLTYEYINSLMAQIYVPINGVLERGVDIPNT